MMPQKNLNRQRLIVSLVVGVAFIILISVVAFAFKSNPSPSNPSSSTQPSTDQSPGPTPTPAPTPTPSDAAKAPLPSPNFSRFDALINEQSFTSDQVDDIQYSLTKYARSIGKPSGTYTLDTNSVTTSVPNQNNPYASAGLNANCLITYSSTGRTYRATIFLSSDTAASISLTDAKTGTQVFSSGNIDLYNGIGD